MQADPHGAMARPIDHGVLPGGNLALGDNLRQGRDILRQRCSVRRDEPQDVVDPCFGLDGLSPQGNCVRVAPENPARRWFAEAGSDREQIEDGIVHRG